MEKKSVRGKSHTDASAYCSKGYSYPSSHHHDLVLCYILFWSYSHGFLIYVVFCGESKSLKVFAWLAKLPSLAHRISHTLLTVFFVELDRMHYGCLLYMMAWHGLAAQ